MPHDHAHDRRPPVDLGPAFRWAVGLNVRRNIHTQSGKARGQSFSRVAGVVRGNRIATGKKLEQPQRAVQHLGFAYQCSVKIEDDPIWQWRLDVILCRVQVHRAMAMLTNCA